MTDQVIGGSAEALKQGIGAEVGGKERSLGYVGAGEALGELCSRLGEDRLFDREGQVGI